jgi:deoxyribodipyrimidine photo-lyase
VQDILFPLSIDRTVSSVEFRKGGTSRAKRLLKVFIAGKLKHYPEHRSDPGLDGISHMSPYLHFGQISPLYIATEVIKAKGVPRAAKDAYLEELIVRRELSINFVHYHPAYGNFTALPGWARQTLERHLADRRPSRYRPEELEKGLTHDPYWNAAQREMALTGSMHNTMRMYWGKKILEWSDSPKDAFYTALRLNNKYQLDGRDPNSYAGVAWCFGKHDRPWMERDIFGTVRYMNDAGLRRKFGMDRYVKKIQDLKA